MRINPFIYGVLVLVVFFGIIVGFQSAGIWSVSGKVDSSGQAIQPSAADVNTIKGWMTLEQISTTFNVPMNELLSQFDLPADTLPSTAISELENDLFSVTNLRTWLQSRSAGSVEIPVAPSVPVPTVIVPTSISIIITDIPASTQPVAPDKTITGKTTFQDLLDWGVSMENIQKVVGSDLPELSTVIKDFITGKGLEFSGVKTQLQVEVDQVK